MRRSTLLNQRLSPIKTTATMRLLATIFTAAFATISRPISSRTTSSNSSQRVVAEAFAWPSIGPRRFALDNKSDSPWLRCYSPPHCSSYQHSPSSSRNIARRYMTTTPATSTASSSNIENSIQNQQQQDQQSVVDMQNALYRIRAVNSMPSDIRQSLLEFRIHGVGVLGKVRPTVAQMLVETDPSVFQLQDHDSNDDESSRTFLTMAPTVGTTSEERSAAIHSVMLQLKRHRLIKGWRDENYPVAKTFYDNPPVFVMERAAVNYLGVLEYGVHINGIIVNANDDQQPGQQKMWMARRSATKSKYPGMLDHIVAGGQPVGMSLLDNCIKECAEEAGIPEHVTRAGLRPVGAISYETYSASTDTVTRAVLFCYDLYLPSDFVPQVVDGEVQEFFAWTVPQLLASLAPEFDDPIKPNCYPVMIDWLLRQGHLSPDVPGYLDVLRELRNGDCQ